MQNLDESKKVFTDCLELCFTNLPTVELIERRPRFGSEPVRLRHSCADFPTPTALAMLALALALTTFTSCKGVIDEAIARISMASIGTELTLIINGIGYASVVVTNDVNVVTDVIIVMTNDVNVVTNVIIVMTNDVNVVTDVIIVMTNDVNVVADVIIVMTNDSSRLIVFVGAEAVDSVCTGSHSGVWSTQRFGSTFLTAARGR